MKKKVFYAIGISLLSLAVYFVQPPKAQSWSRGTWENVYNGGSTPAYQECMSSLATRCVTGDIRSLKPH